MVPMSLNQDKKRAQGHPDAIRPAGSIERQRGHSLRHVKISLENWQHILKTHHDQVCRGGITDFEAADEAVHFDHRGVKILAKNEPGARDDFIHPTGLHYFTELQALADDRPHIHEALETLFEQIEDQFLPRGPPLQESYSCSQQRYNWHRKRLDYLNPSRKSSHPAAPIDQAAGAIAALRRG
jgi:hypothetical protein